AGKNTMRTFQTGRSEREGFTLFELVIVIFIISLTTALVMPSFWKSSQRSVRSEAKRIANTLRYIYDEAAGKKQLYTVTFDVDKGSWQFRSETETRSFTMKDDVTFRDIMVPSLGNVSRGELVMEFGPLGPAEPVTIHLSKDSSEYTVIFNHMNGRAKVHKGYVVIEPDIDGRKAEG
ncbi:MAG: prepilin-type N-terminal cleavage/methylation domain-containing protein, partial [Nitrospirota bacterium]|nr:prepilin-type N-terminal cleavage/methylation domain-containing protein [Nitrospirota bacterium]